MVGSTPFFTSMGRMGLGSLGDGATGSVVLAAYMLPSETYLNVISSAQFMAGDGYFAGKVTDTTAPAVTSFSPLDNATGVAITTNLVATMSETVTLGASGVITLKKTSDNSTIDSWNVATAGGSTAGKVEVVGGTALTMHLTTSLANSIEYYVIWDAGVVKDAANNPVAAQSSTTLWSFTTVAGGFTGLLDTYPTATMAYSFRKLRNAYAGSAVRIRRSSDNAEANIGFLANGDFDSAAASAHIGGGSGFIVTWFDQSGNGIDVTQATAADQPAYNATGLNSFPTAISDATDELVRSIANTSLPLVTTTAMMVLVDPGGNNVAFSWNQGSSGNTFELYGAYGTVIYSDFGTTFSTGRSSVGVPAGWYTGAHLLEVGREGTGNQFITVDGVELDRATGKTDVMTALTANFKMFLAASSTTLRISELVIWAADLAANRSAARANVAAYWLWGAPGYLIGDLGVMPTRAYSTRKLRSNHIGSAIRIRRSSDNAEQDIGFSGENLDTAAITTFVGSNSAYVVKWYDQSGSADDCAQTTSAQQARIVNAGTLDVRNGKACPLFDGTDDSYGVTAGTFSFWTSSAIAAVNYAGPNFTNYNSVWCTTGVANGLLGGSATASFYSSMPVISVNNTGTAVATFGGTAMQVLGVIGSLSTTGQLMIGRDNSGGREWSGWIGEVVFFNTDLSGTNDTAMYTNQKTYWGTP